MKHDMTVDQGAFSAEGEVIKAAEILVKFFDLELSEYRQIMGLLTKEFGIDYASTIFRHNRDIMVKGQDAIHDAKNPHEGDRTKL